jgi:hypothetical protein
MAVKLVAEQDLQPGKRTAIQAESPTPPFAVVFEDDGTTGYFYALDKSRSGNPILDTLHIYNVASVNDRHLTSKVQLVWSQDDKKAALLINRYPHAIFDFEGRRGYCRSAFPAPAKDGWTQHGHEWHDDAEELFR